MLIEESCNPLGNPATGAAKRNLDLTNIVEKSREAAGDTEATGTTTTTATKMNMIEVRAKSAHTDWYQGEFWEDIFSRSNLVTMIRWCEVPILKNFSRLSECGCLFLGS
jgi:hypothetical protein